MANKFSVPEDITQVEPNKEFAEAREERDDNVPDGYITIELSTKGKLYAPKKFHIRNFSAEDLLGMALVDDDTLPIKVISMLNDLILEKDVDVGKFHEKEVLETLFILYKTFYTSTLKDVPYNLTDDDYKYLQDTLGGADADAYIKQIRDYNSKRWVPKISIDLNKVKTYELPEDFKPTVRVINNRTGFTCKYGFPQYGDVRDLNDFIQIIYKEEDEKMAPIVSKLRYIEEQKQKRDNGEPIPFESIPTLTSSEEKAYRDYAMRRNITTMRATRAAHLLEYRGKDISDLSIEKKLTLADDPELDLKTYTAISKKLDSTNIGLQKTVKVVSPVTNKEIDYPFSFRLFDVLQAISTTEPDGITIEFE